MFWITEVMMQALMPIECLVLYVLFIGDSGLENKLQVHVSDQQIEDHFSTDVRYHKFQADYGAHSPLWFWILSCWKTHTKERKKIDYSQKQLW